MVLLSTNRSTGDPIINTQYNDLRADLLNHSHDGVDTPLVTDFDNVHITSGLTIDSGSVVITNGSLSLPLNNTLISFAGQATAGTVRGGGGGFALQNAAGSANNILVTDAGVSTFRAGVVITTGGVQSTGEVVVTAANSVFSTTGATTGAQYARMVNTGGTAFFGVDNSTGATLFGAGAYSAGVAAPAALVLRTGGSVNALILSSAGNATFAGNAAVTGTLGVTGAATFTSYSSSGAGSSGTTFGVGTTLTVSGGLINVVGAAANIRGTTGGGYVSIQPNTGGFFVVNNAGTINNLGITDAGAATFAGTVTASGLLTAGAALAVTGAVTITQTGSAFATANGGTFAEYGRFVNTGGTAYVGIDDSTGATLFASGAYAAGMQVPANFVVRVGGGTVGINISSAGQAAFPVTGSSGGILVGGDVQWFRAAADVWGTPDAVQFGTNPAASGTLRLNLASTIMVRNQLNNADITVFATSNDANNYQFFGPQSSGTYLQFVPAGGAILVGGGTTIADFGTGGTVFGAATGGAKGVGTINAKAVYDDNVILTDFVFEPGYQMLPIDGMARFFREHLHLPTIPGRERWESTGSFSVGQLATRLWETVEVQAIYIAQLHDRLAALEARV
jgi:hypothetical protein